MTVTVVTIGDSITLRQQWQAQVLARLTADFGSGSVVRLGTGLSGGTTADLRAQFPGAVLDAGDADYVVILGGINDRAADWPAAETIAHLQAMYSAAHAVKTRVVAVTILPFLGNESWAWTPDRQAATDAVNRWITTDAVDVDYVVDGYGALGDPSDARALQSPAYTRYGDGTFDHLHPNPEGMIALGNAIYDRVTWTAAQWYVGVTEDVCVPSSAVAWQIRGRAGDSASCVNFGPNRGGQRYAFLQAGPEGFRIGGTKAGVPLFLYSNGVLLRGGRLIVDATGALGIEEEA